MSEKFPWLKLRKKTDPDYEVEPPIRFGNHSNGEYFHEATRHERRLRREILRRADEQAGRLGLDRREFLASSMGMAVTLSVINQYGCSSAEDDTDQTGSGGGGGASGDAGGGGGAAGGGFDFGDGPYVVPPEATCEPAGVLEADDYFIMDVQTHSFDDGDWRERNTVYPIFLGTFSGCTTRTDPLDCFDRDRYGELMFVDSDTDVAVITSWPAATCFPERDLLGYSAVACGLPLSNDGMRELRDYINSKAMSQRVINQVQVMPNDMIERQIEGMYAAMDDPDFRAGSWKCYPAWRSDTYPSPEGYARGYFLTDPVGLAFIEAGLKLGVPNFAVHKGLPIPGFDVEHNQPSDIGPVAKMFPEANFVIYHSAISAGTGGGVLDAVNPFNTESVPYDANEASPTGVNQLIRSLLEEGVVEDPDITGQPVGPHNVYAEMGSAWSRVLGNPNDAQHYIGKLLKYLGPDNIVWGTDAILGGSPQGQIMAFRAFTITPEYQDMYGYPELTDEIKAKIFGRTAANLYRVDADATRCNVQQSDFALIKRDLDGELGTGRWVAKPPIGPRTRREFFELAKLNQAKGLPG